MIWKRKISCLMLAFLFLIPAGLFSTSPAAAMTESGFTSDAGVDEQGEVLHTSVGGNFAYPDDGEIGVYGSGGITGVQRTFLSFNTSSLPNGATVETATLRVCVDSSNIHRDWYVRVYDTDYTVFSNALWAPTGEFQGNIIAAKAFVSIPSGTWYSLALDPDTISLTGNSTFMLNSSVETPYWTNDRLMLQMGDGSDSASILDITYSSPIGASEVDIEVWSVSAHTWLNGTMYPEVLDYNSTYDIWKFEIDTVPDTANVTVEKAVPGSDFAGVVPNCLVIENSTAIILNNTYDSITYRLYMTVPKSGAYNFAFITLYDANTGLGIPWNTFQVKMSRGLTYNATSGYSIYYQEQTVVAGYNYTVQVSDYFGRVIKNYSFVSVSEGQIVPVPITTYNWKMTNQRDHFSLLTIYYGYYPSAYNYSLYVAPKSSESLDLAPGNYSFSAQTYFNNATVGETEWFNRSVNSSGYIILEGTTWVKASIYNRFTGLGLPWYYFNTTYQIEGEAQNESVMDSLIPAKFDHNLTIVVRDYFAREIYNGTRTITGNATSWNIPLSTYSEKFYNEMDNFTLVSIYRNGYGPGPSPLHPPYAEFLAPREVRDYQLISGDYTFAVKPYYRNGTTGNSIWFNRTLGGPSIIIINGTCISEILSNVQDLNYTITGDLSMLISNVSAMNGTINWSNMTITWANGTITAINSTSYWINGTATWANATITVIGTFQAPRVHISYYNAFTGIGIAPYSFNVSAKVDGVTNLSRIQSDLANGIINRNMTIVVKDFFGRELYNESKNITSVDYYWDIPLYVYSYKVMNNGDQFTRWWIYYNHPALTTPYREYIPPREYSEYFLLAGTYRFATTVFDSNGITGLTYTYVRTLSDAGYVMLEGATITEVLNVANGVKATQIVITDYLTPDIVFIGRDVPAVPASISSFSSSTLLDTKYVLEAMTMETKTGTFTYFNTSIPEAAANVSVILDEFYFTGTSTTRIYVNQSTTNVLTATTLPSTATLSGDDYTIWTNNSISSSRQLWFRYSNSFSFEYYPETDEYTVDLTIGNTGETTWRDVYFFVPYQNSSRVDNRSVEVYDINNTIYLVEGTNYVLSDTGIHMWFLSISNDTFRGFRISYTTTNETPDQIAEVTVVTIGDGTTTQTTWNGAAFWFSYARWTNTYRERYQGPLYITMATNPMPDPDTVIVLTTTGYVVTDAVVSGASIMIPQITLEPGESITYTIIFQSSAPDDMNDISIGGVPVLGLTILVSALALIFSIYFLKMAKSKNGKAIGRIFVGILVLSLFLSFLLVAWYIGIT